MKFNLNKNVKIIEYKDKLVLANTINGQWVRITKEVFDIIKAILDEEYKLDEIANCFEDICFNKASTF